jgi:hypothetical protein
MPKNTSTLWWVIGGVLVVAAGLIALGHYSAAPATTGTTSSSTSSGSGAVADSSALPGIQLGNAPWVPEILHLRERLTAIGLPALAQEGTVLHIHQHLDIFIDGKPMAVPAEIGINAAAGFISPIHVHDTSGIMHVESPVTQTFYLGQFFDIWGVRLTSACIGGYCATTASSTSANAGSTQKDTKSVKVYVNGTLYQGDPRQLVLTSHQEIVIAYGTDAETPKAIPAAYTFPAGY